MRDHLHRHSMSQKLLMAVLGQGVQRAQAVPGGPCHHNLYLLEALDLLRITQMRR